MVGSDVTVPRGARPYQGRPAGLVSRFVAAAVDGVVVLLLLVLGYGGTALAALFLKPRSFQLPDLGPWFSLLAFWSVLVLYLTASWWLSGRSYGALLMGLRVVDRQRDRPGLVVAVGRALVCALFPVGLLWSAVSPQNRAVHDILFGTAVLYDWR